VKLLKEGESPESVKQEASLEKTLQNKLNLLQQRLDNASELSEIKELTETITALLDTLARLKSKKP